MGKRRFLIVRVDHGKRVSSKHLQWYVLPIMLITGTISTRFRETWPLILHLCLNVRKRHFP